MLLASVWPLIPGLQSNNAHQTTQMMPPSREPRLGKVSCNLAAAKERLYRGDPIGLTRQL